MELAVGIIAFCQVLLTMFTLVALAVLAFVGIRLSGTLRRVEGLLEDVKRETIPILSQSRMLVEDVREVGRTVRHQVGRSEYMIENTIRSINDTSTRVREAVTGLSLVLSTTGRILSLFSRKKSDE